MSAASKTGHAGSASFDPLAGEGVPAWALPAAGWLLLLLVTVAVVCGTVVAVFGAFPGDAATRDEVREQALGPLVLAPAHALDWVGSPVAALVLTVLVAAWAWLALGWRYALLVAGVLGANVVTLLLKGIVGRARPATDGLLDPSFPSGHTTFAASVIGAAALIAVQQRHWRTAAAFGVVIAAMGPSRVLLGVHWASDVVAGYAIGAAWLLGVVLVGLPRTRRPCSAPSR
ncbi:phosphatase PAP2 family protein [Paraconexibacter antarcticus]|uniref:Phosphatase PAP2 family protein n=1 Tax=Paraconexibacter antarcticus TaxID=2949664 RepID=A0ABY5DR51_9ACTN|nr:phosphatase PAP2 family protein [Paraconexibacter antarcticus]UTI63389.1 phosphatase PAP2 family protein [Paraconexibacter antarcticus]